MLRGSMGSACAELESRNSRVFQTSCLCYITIIGVGYGIKRSVNIVWEALELRIGD